jgi:hypothetical protein
VIWLQVITSISNPLGAAEAAKSTFNNIASAATSTGKSMMGGAVSGGENLGNVADKSSQDTPIGGKINYLK